MAHHLLVFPDIDTAQRIAGELAEEGFADVSVTPGRDGSGEVSIDDSRLPVQDGHSTVEALKTRFQALADEHRGQYVESQPGEAGVIGAH